MVCGKCELDDGAAASLTPAEDGGRRRGVRRPDEVTNEGSTDMDRKFWLKVLLALTMPVWVFPAFCWVVASGMVDEW